MVDINDLIQTIDSEAQFTYVPENYSAKEKNLLVITPSLKLQGALTVLVELLSYYENKSVQLFILSPEDGNYRDILLSMGCIVVIREYVSCSSSYRKFLQTAFDGVFINSAACNFYAYYFMNTTTKVLWWFHETKEQLSTMLNHQLHLGLLSENFTLAGVMPSVQKGLKELFDVDAALLPMAIADRYNGNKELQNKVTFFLPAGYTFIKGQDVLLKAILLLPPEERQKAVFIFCGYQLEGQMEYYEKIKNLAAKIPEVLFAEELPQEEVFDLYKKADCVLAPSRVDATPTTIVEAMMFETLCLVSDATGMAAYIEDCKNGFVFPSENAEELMKRLLLIIHDRDSLTDLAEAGRKVYEEHFTKEAVFAKYATLWDL